MTFLEQPKHNAVINETRLAPAVCSEGEELVIDTVLTHRRARKCYEFLTLFKGAPIPEAEWQPNSDFVDSDGTITKLFLDSITK